MRRNELKAKVLFALSGSEMDVFTSDTGVAKIIFGNRILLNDFVKVTSVIEELIVCGWLIRSHHPDSLYVKLNADRLALMFRDEMDS